MTGSSSSPFRGWMIFGLIIAMAFVVGAALGGTGITLLHTCGTDKCGSLSEHLISLNPATGMIAATVVAGVVLVAGRRAR